MSKTNTVIARVYTSFSRKTVRVVHRS